MIRTILVALDGSHLAEQALGHACRVARQTDASVLLLRVAPFTMVSESLAAPGSGTVREAEVYLDTMRERLERGGFTVDTLALHGLASQVIASTAQASGADLIVMGTHGRSGLRQVVLGSVAQEVLHHTTLALLLVRASDPQIEMGTGPYHSILVPLDGTTFAEAALSYLAREGLDREAALVLLRAVPPPVDPAMAGLSGYYPAGVFEQEASGVEVARLAALQYLDSLAQTNLHGRAYKTLVRVDDPARAIVEAAASEGVEVIVMATHGRTGLDRLVHGSVARHVLHHTPIPVLFLHQVADDTSIPDVVVADEGNTPR